MSPRALWFVAPGQVELRTAEPAALGDGEVRARALASGVSQGTELLLYRGDGPTPFDPSLDAPGAPTYPRRYGYAWIGEVTESRSATLRPGERVFALAPHGEEHAAPASAFRALSPAIPAERAVLAANLETAVNVVWDARIGLGDRVLVLGGGVVGLLAGYAARSSGARHVVLIEPSAVRRRAALSLAFDAAVAPGELRGCSEADVVIEATGDPTCLDEAIAHARLEGVVVVASFYGKRAERVELGSAFHRRRLTLLSSQVSRLPSWRVPGWSHARRFELVGELLRDERLGLLLDAPVPFSEAAATYERLSGAPGDALQTVFLY